MSFTWTEFYNELFIHVVKEYDSKSLVEVTYKIFPRKSLMDRDASGREIPLDELDPCTFLARFNRGETIENKIKYCQKAKEILRLKSSIPEDFDGIPIFQNVQYWFFPHKEKRIGDEFDNLWEFAKDLANGEIKEDSFNAARKSHGAGMTYLTDICFIVWPEKYLPLDKITSVYLEKRDPSLLKDIKEIGKRKNIKPFTDYIKILKKVSALFEGKSFKEISLNAYREHKESGGWKNNNDLNNAVHYWLAGASFKNRTEDKTKEYIDSGVWINGFKEDSNDRSVKLVKQARLGDYIAIKSTATKGKGHETSFTRIKAIGVITENEGNGVNLKVKWIYTGHYFDVEGLYYGKTFQQVKKKEDIEKLFAPVNDNGTSSSTTVAGIVNDISLEYNSENPQNVIYWGPPGTGKTLRLLKLQKTFEDHSDKNDLDYISSCVQDLTWWEVIAASLIEINHPVTVPELFKHDLIQAKSKQSSTKTPKSTIWSLLQTHAIKQSQTVYYKNREEPLVVDKDNNSRWYLAGNWKDELADLTSVIEKIRSGKINEVIKRYEMVTFHQSYSYEEFVEGIRPIIGGNGSSIQYEVKLGIFRRLCQRASENPNQQYAMFIDEINRGNISKIFGELITLIEIDKRKGQAHEISITLPYSGDSFVVPSNLHIFCTMNSVDRSIALVDMALRRRFKFITLRPDSSKITNQISDVNIIKIFDKLNDRISAILGSEYQLGHSYFMENKSSNLKALKETWFDQVLPLLQEYFFDDWEKLHSLVGEFVTFKEVAGLEDQSLPRTSYGKFVQLSISDDDFKRLLKALE